MNSDITALNGFLEADAGLEAQEPQVSRGKTHPSHSAHEKRAAIALKP